LHHNNKIESTVISQQSTVNSHQSTVNSQQSTVNSQQSTVNFDDVEFLVELAAVQAELGGGGGGIGLMRDAMFVDFAEEFEGIGLESAAVEFLEGLQGLAGEGFGKVEVSKAGISR
jgi:hypothetical protein